MKYKALMLAIAVLLMLLGANNATAISIWNAGVTVGADGGSLSAGVELGVKLRSDVDGYISGIRFYKYPGTRERTRGGSGQPMGHCSDK